MAVLSADLFIPFLEQGAELPVYQRVFRAIQQAIIEGKILPGAKLPASRELCQLLSVSRNSVKSAYELLQAEGYIETRVGAGSFVSVSVPDAIAVGADRRTSVPVNKPLSDQARRIADARPINSHRSGDLLLPARPSLDCFPWMQWQRSVAAAGKAMKFSLGTPAGGEPRLRQQIAEHLNVVRGLNCNADQVMVFSGSQQAIFMTLSLLLNQGESIMVEDPGFPGIDGAIAATGAIKVSVPTDESGFVLNSGLKQAPDARVAMLTPSRNYPMGYTLSLKRRIELLQWSEQNGAWIIEDDYDSEFRFDGPPLTALQGMGGENQVIYLGTFSRILHPSIRLGYAVLPQALVRSFEQARRYYDGGLPSLPQLAMADFMERGCFASHCRKMRKLYAGRRAYLNGRMAELFGDQLVSVPSDGGMHSVYLLASDCDDVALCQRLACDGVGVRPLSPYFDRTAPRPGLVIGFAGYSEQEIDKGLKVLQQCL
ncbi:MocR-like pyridoxine biosynthesis transcription factor PdxR [Marinobacterium jannaschii]|uniref:MocR-like pyridoxine biosynthesis transcription factor PdxR n=1 Tax=Marinobacterium jannaschii TaxID=64970 RepID=UPI001FE1C5D0|nr:PLP-dependent aminotransferase family protein [Marinobacterium jannaschii]